MGQQFELLLPPEDLVHRVAGTSDPAWFVQSGHQSVKDIELALNSVGRTVAEHNHILDFGCGCGRIMLQFRDMIPMTVVTGVDIDADAVAWLRPHVPESTLRVINELPPMPFAPASFDLVYCHSVFTHLDSFYQDRWLEELWRVCKPGASLVISFSGQTALHKLEEQWTKANADPAPLRKQLEDSGILFIADDGWKKGPFPDFYHSTFHTAAYVKEHWGHYFKVLNHLPSGSLGFQDFIVMERAMDADCAMTLNERADKESIIPMPPEAFRALVGPKEDVFYDNPGGQLIFPEIPPQLYAAVFDFGCGCGRHARQLMQQNARPEHYVGVDIHRGMVGWCQSHLSAIDPNFRFLHHNVYNPGLAPDNQRKWTAPFPVAPNEFTLVNAHSVFTHLYKEQTEFYLREIERILVSQGVARTTWFFFDRAGYPWLEKWQNCLFVNADDPTNAVIYDWQWFLDAVRSAGLVVRQTILPAIPGHQWQVFLERRREASIHNFPPADIAAEWFCGAIPSQRVQLANEVERLSAENKARSAEIGALRSSWSWRLTQPVRKFVDFLANW